MPLYEYECSQCGHRFELIRRFSDPPAEACPACGLGPVNKLLSAPAVHFKGTGWYVTDYAKKTGASAVRTDAGPGEAGKSDGSAADSKPAGDSKPADAKPAGDSKPADAKPAAAEKKQESSSKKQE